MTQDSTADATCTPEQAAAMDFEPMQLDPFMPPAEFRDQAQSVYAWLALSHHLFTKDPEDPADALFQAGPVEETLKGINTAREWFEGFATVLSCMEERMFIALAKDEMKI